MRVKELRRLADNKPNVLLFNPLLRDFLTQFIGYASVVLKAGEITSVDGGIADRVKKQLITFIMNEREVDPLSKTANAISEEVTVIL